MLLYMNDSIFPHLKLKTKIYFIYAFNATRTSDVTVSLF